MASNILQTKIALLCKSLPEWEQDSSYVPLKGEVCIATIPLNTGQIHNAPTVLCKVGNGTQTFAQLKWMSALATDVYSWAKKESLDFSDLDDTFLAALDTEIVDKAGALTDFQIVETETDSHIWKLQKSVDKGPWTDISTFKVNPEVFAKVDYVSDSIATLTSQIEQEITTERTARVAGDNLKVDKEIAGTHGTARIFNESDGGGAKFEHNDGSEVYVGVNDGGMNGMMAQIYADIKKDNKWSGSRINVFNDKIVYTNQKAVDSGVEINDAEYEIATVGDVKAVLDKINNFADIAKTGNVNDLIQTEGDSIFLNCNS